MSALRVLDISSCGLSFSLPKWVRNFKNLTHLNVAWNAFNAIEDGMSYILSHLCSLKSFDMRQNKFLNQPLLFNENVSGCNEYDLEFLSLASTGLTGNFPDFVSKFRKLKYLLLGANALHGPIPTTLAENFPLLRVLDLSSNQFNGIIPYSIGDLANIETFDVSYNSLEGEVYDHIHLSNLSNLKVFSTGINNLLTFVFKPDWDPPFQLKKLDMRSCKVNKFPQWLETQTILITSYLSNASISDSFPKWIQNNPHLIHLDLSHNHIKGPFPQNFGDIFPAMRILYLFNNRINGTIPKSLCKWGSLWHLDLSENMLAGDIPNCWGDINVNILNLASNSLTGNIPSSIGHSSSLQWLHLNNNSLEGELPLSLRNCTKLLLLNLGENRFSGNLPSWIGEDLSALQLLRLRKNMFDGHIPQEICQLTKLSFLDLAENKLVGRIPHCLGNLSRMLNRRATRNELHYTRWDEVNVEVVVKGREYTFTKTLRLLVNMDLSLNNLVGTIPEEITNLDGLFGLNLSHNHLTGNIPKSIGKLTVLESLDFSENKLSGSIPTGLSDLTALSNLNLAGNNLSGKIPRGRQLETIDHDNPSIYADNPELCGEPLEKRCPGDHAALTPTTSSDNADDDDDDEHDKIWLYSFVTLGYAAGLWGFIGVLVLKKNWRVAFFRFADEMRGDICQSSSWYVKATEEDDAK